MERWTIMHYAQIEYEFSRGWGVATPLGILGNSETKLLYVEPG